MIGMTHADPSTCSCRARKREEKVNWNHTVGVEPITDEIRETYGPFPPRHTLVVVEKFGGDDSGSIVKVIYSGNRMGRGIEHLNNIARSRAYAYGARYVHRDVV
jgi:hypothetical protein